jgi:hypothetical protein
MYFDQIGWIYKWEGGVTHAHGGLVGQDEEERALDEAAVAAGQPTYKATPGSCKVLFSSCDPTTYSAHCLDATVPPTNRPRLYTQYNALLVAFIPTYSTVLSTL